MDLRIFTEPQQGASYTAQLAMAQRAERLGFSAFFRSDHFVRMGDGDPLPGPTDAWTTLAGLAHPQKVLEGLGALAEQGIGRVYLQCLDIGDLEHLDLIATEVMAHLPGSS